MRDVDQIRRFPLDLLPETMRTFELKIVVGKGLSSQTMTLPVKPFTCIGTVTSESECPRKLKDAFDTITRLQAYQLPEMLELTARALRRAGLSVEVATTQLIARLAAGNPKKAQSIVGRLAALGNKTLSQTESEEILSAYGYIVGGQNTSPRDASNLTNLSGMQFERLITELLENGFSCRNDKSDRGRRHRYRGRARQADCRRALSDTVQTIRARVACWEPDRSRILRSDNGRQKGY